MLILTAKLHNSFHYHHPNGGKIVSRSDNSTQMGGTRLNAFAPKHGEETFDFPLKSQVALLIFNQILVQMSIVNQFDVADGVFKVTGINYHLADDRRLNPPG